ncbi:MAG TPA: carbon starvation CstA 5TM domain-containing protein, partial [Nitrospiria bacterium]|nr:carbon starvation CstA 5TM domain-containing protein [Nitrospiria bacterium]
AALSLLGISVWLMKEGKNYLITFIPMIFVMIMTIWSLIIQAGPMIRMVLGGRIGFDINGTIAIILIVLATLLVREAYHVIYAYRAGGMMVTKRE